MNFSQIELSYQDSWFNLFDLELGNYIFYFQKFNIKLIFLN